MPISSQMPAPSPVVSIILLSYNYGRFLARSIESALAQDYPPEALDIIVIDDGSTDSTPEVVRPYLDRVRYIRKPNGGLLSSVNRGLDESQGEFIALLSADDEYLPQKTRAQVDFLRSHPAVGMVYSDLEVVDEVGHQIKPSLWESANLSPVRGRAFGALLERNVVSGGAMMFRATLKPVFHPIPDTAAWEDWYIALKIAAVAEIDYLPEPLYKYRFHGENMNLGARDEKAAALMRTELPFRRMLLSELEPGLVTVSELMGGWAGLNRSAASIAQITGEPLESVIEVTDEQRASCQAVAADPDAGAVALVGALALDPWNTTAQERLLRALTPPPLDGVRAFATLAFAAELVAAPEMLEAYATAFTGSDDATLVVFGSGDEIEALVRVLDELDLDGPGAPDMLAVSDGTPLALAGSVRAIYSRRPQRDVLAGCPRVDDSRPAILRELAADVGALPISAPVRPQRP